jgi:hypothetical protein
LHVDELGRWSSRTRRRKTPLQRKKSKTPDRGHAPRRGY